MVKLLIIISICIVKNLLQKPVAKKLSGNNRAIEIMQGQIDKFNCSKDKLITSIMK